MIFITLQKLGRGTHTREAVDRTTKNMEEDAKLGVKRIAVYWTLGAYDSVSIIEAPDEETFMKAILSHPPNPNTPVGAVTVEHLVAVKREDALKLLPP